MTVWTKIVYDLLSNTSQKTLMVMHIGYNELIEWIILRPNANVNQNLQEIALRGLLDWFVMLIFYTEGVQWFVQLVWKAVDNCYDVKNQLLGEQYQLFGEHVDFHIQVLMAVFWWRWLYCRQRCFFSLLSCYQSPMGLISLWLMLLWKNLKQSEI